MNQTEQRGELHVVLGTGPLGQATARALLERGATVRMVNRRGSHPTLANVEVCSGDLYNPTVVQTLTAGATAVYQCAQPAYYEWPQKFPSLIESILAGVAASGAKLIVGDNLYMYGPVAGAMTEDLPNAATTRKGRTRAAMSEALLAAHKAGRVRVAIGRGADFYGPAVRQSTLGDRVFPAALAGKAAEILGDPDQPHTFTFIDDFGAALATLGADDRALGQIWHVPNAPTLTTRAVLAALFTILGTPLKMRTMGLTMLRLGGLFLPVARESIEMFYQFNAPFVVDSSKYTNTFGGNATPIQEGLQRTLAWYRNQEGRQRQAA